MTAMCVAAMPCDDTLPRGHLRSALKKRARWRAALVIGSLEDGKMWRYASVLHSLDPPMRGDVTAAVGARGRNRTGMGLPPADFKSDASTSFATRATARIGCLITPGFGMHARRCAPAQIAREYRTGWSGWPR